MDFTQLSTFQQCPERYRLRYVEQVRKVKDEPESTPLKFGEAIHAALKLHYEGQPAPTCHAAFLTLYPTVTDPQEKMRTPVNGLTVLQAYQDHYALTDKTWKVLAVEQVLDLPLDGLTWQVKLDLVVETEGGIWGVEHKTTQQPLIERYWRQFEPNSQLSSQTYSIQHHYGQCSGIIVNALHLGYRERMYRGEPAGFNYAFQRQIFNRTPRQLEDWKHRTIQSIKRLDATQQTASWEKNETACTYCEFRELCMSCDDPGVRETLYEGYEAMAYLGPSKTGGDDGSTNRG